VDIAGLLLKIGRSARYFHDQGAEGGTCTVGPLGATSAQQECCVEQILELFQEIRPAWLASSQSMSACHTTWNGRERRSEPRFGNGLNLGESSRDG
jgi:hypothetical protein